MQQPRENGLWGGTVNRQEINTGNVLRKGESLVTDRVLRLAKTTRPNLGDATQLEPSGKSCHKEQNTALMLNMRVHVKKKKQLYLVYK